MDASEYYKIRLDHTIQHLQQATRLIYFIGGAVVAMFYFVIEKIPDATSKRVFAIGLLVLLGLVNVIHGLLITVQSRWYKLFDKELAASTSAKIITRGKTRLSTSGLWAALHWLVALAAFSGASYVWCSNTIFK
jgi:hypothetical protein